MIYNFKDFLFEFNVNKTNIDLQTEYDKLNKELFNNKLLNVPMKWEKNIKSSGRVFYRLNNDRKTYHIDFLGISEYIQLDYKRFRDILAHEMIHVYIHQNNIKDYGGTHGIMFRNKMDEINKKGFNITIKDDVTDDLISADNKLSKPACAIVILEMNKDIIINKSIVVWDMKLYNENKDKFISTMSKYYSARGKKVNIFFYESQNATLRKYSIKKVFNKIETYMLNDALYNELIKDKLLEKVEI